MLLRLKFDMIKIDGYNLLANKFYPTLENDYNCKFSKNNLCNTRWSLRDWKIDESSVRTRDVVFDNRWEGLLLLLILILALLIQTL